VFWLTQVVRRVANHLISYGAGIDDFLPKALKNNPDLQSRMLVVQELEMVPVECIVRAYLTGSGWSAYEKTGQICGITLPEGLHDGSKLPWGDIFTPTTKAEEGHDEHLGAADVLSQYGPGLQTLSFRAFSLGSRHAEERGILLADTKFEFGRNTEGRFVLADEVMTPDSSRFWLNSDYEEVSAKKRSPSGFDKQLVREWGKTVLTPFTGTDGEQIVGLQNLDPTLQEHREFVGGVEVPEDVVGETTRRYLDVFYKLTGYSLRDFQRLYMGIKV
jgi:phosphoribosylaminoimidazole-succinocarboxamide synthase